MIGRNRYALLTVDTEALPKRAAAEHVKRLMWGQHEQGRAGVAEMAGIGDEFGVKHVFFVDLCGAYAALEEALAVVRWLDAAGQDVQLHTHPEYLSATFWKELKLPQRPQYANQYADVARAEAIIRHFAGLLSQATGKPMLAHRAGSFRWNATTLEALQAVGIPLSFNNSMSAVHAGQCVYSEPTNAPFRWSNGIVEIPMSEKQVLPKVGKAAWWARLTYPESPYFRFRPWWGKLSFDLFSGSPDLSVFLLHSWSLLHWDGQGHAVYRDDQRLEGYRKLLARLSRDYDVITSKDCLDLIAQGKLAPTHTVDVAKAAMPASPSPAVRG